MTKRQARMLHLALDARARWIRGDTASDAAVLGELARMGFLHRRRTDAHFEYRPNIPAIKAARQIGLLPEKP